MKNACLVYAYILIYCPRPTPTPAKHHRPSNLSSPIFYLNETMCLSYTITILVFSPRVSSSAFLPPTHLGYPAPQPARIPLLCSTLDDVIVVLFGMFCLLLLSSQGSYLTFLLEPHELHSLRMVDVDGRLGYLRAYASDTAHCGTRTKSNVTKFGHASKCEVVEGEGRCSNRAGDGERARRQGAS
jgi:hypothetical protein